MLCFVFDGCLFRRWSNPPEFVFAPKVPINPPTFGESEAHPGQAVVDAPVPLEFDLQNHSCSLLFLFLCLPVCLSVCLSACLALSFCRRCPYRITRNGQSPFDFLSGGFRSLRMMDAGLDSADVRARARSQDYVPTDLETLYPNICSTHTRQASSQSLQAPWGCLP